jgi:hypothetical protein
MILKFSSKTDNSEWTFADKITWLTTNKNPLQGKDDNFTLEIRFRQKEEELPAIRFKKEDAVYLLNDEGKTIECLN